MFKLPIYLFFSFVILSGELNNWDERLLRALPPWFVSLSISYHARNITFEVYDNENFLGSGTLIYRQKNRYLVLTNKHVLRSKKKSYQVKAPDGELHKANALDIKTFPQDDLILLSFQSDRPEYKPPEFRDYSRLQIDEVVFAAGFPSELAIANKAQLTTNPSPTVTKGQVTRILDKPLVDGYQIAYSNDVHKGMSGGPLLDKSGKVVGVNGKQAYPLWEIPELYQNSSPVDESLQNLINRSSLAIPITKALNFATSTN